MPNRTLTFVSLLIVAVVTVSAVGAEKLPENLARKAKVSASSQFSGEYRPSQAINGSVSGSDWAVKGMQTGEFTLQWAKPVDAAQIVYWARTAGQHLEAFKDYEVYLNGGKTPAVKGSLERRHGPQLINLTKQKVSNIRIKF
ncbi:MAG: hypothetical protein QGG25_02620, partial [Phycisphaerae bacterium]|nr:hypothetical protein [Phycisphaerae bacterium]